MRVARKIFLGTTALAASAAALAGCRNRETATVSKQLGTLVYPVLTPKQYDYAGMMAKIQVPNRHKQLFAGTGTGVQTASSIAAVFQHMQFAMNGYAFSLVGSPQVLATLGVLSGTAVIFALNDGIWQRYGFAHRFGVAETNIYYRATSPLDLSAAPDDPKGIYQDWSAQAVMKRGGTFLLCHNALTYLAADCAYRGGKQPRDVLEDWMANLLPGFTVVPSGVVAIQIAAEHGWRVYPSG